MSSRENTGMALGLIGVIIFSLTLPMTRIVVQEVHPLLNGLGRALLASIPAALLLLVRREKWPTWTQVKGLMVVALGVIVGVTVRVIFEVVTVRVIVEAIVVGRTVGTTILFVVW